MQFLSLSTFLRVVSLALLASFVSAESFSVVVGNNNANTFEPSSLTNIKAGDTISFKFVSKNHTLTQSTFTTPCTKKPDGVDSGFVPIPAGTTTFPEWTIAINNVSAPLWFYCAQAQHCAAGGMVFAINPTGEKTFAAFQALATGSTTAPTGSTTTATPGSTTTSADGSTTSTTNSSTSADGTTTNSTTSTDDTSANAGSDSGALSSVHVSVGRLSGVVLGLVGVLALAL